MNVIVCSILGYLATGVLLSPVAIHLLKVDARTWPTPRTFSLDKTEDSTMAGLAVIAWPAFLIILAAVLIGWLIRRLVAKCSACDYRWRRNVR